MKGGLVQLKVSYEDQRDGITVVRVDSDGQGGVLNFHSAPELRKVLVQLAEEGRLLMVVDLSGVDDINGDGLGVLVGGLKRVHFKGGTLSLVVTNERVRAVLSKSRLTRVFRIHDTVPGAVGKLLGDYADESIEQRRAAIEERARERLARETLGATTRVVVSDGFSYEHLTESISLVKVAVELDVHSAVSLRNVLVDLVKQGRFFLVVDLTAIDQIDSTGLGVLVGALKRVYVQAGALALVVTSDRVVKTFRTTGLTKVFSIFRTVHPAVEYLGREDLRAHA
ncbi:regulator [Streptomyces atratus]|uniref:Anti-sigma factor antagonist n=1 Tax=Streptomyces atratus TaxID=1893 RepID=A0A2Z5JK78_STRAR|nr:regulator [Streptomyces atratus]